MTSPHLIDAKLLIDWPHNGIITAGLTANSTMKSIWRVFNKERDRIPNFEVKVEDRIELRTEWPVAAAAKYNQY